MHPVIKLFTSLRLTVVLLGLSLPLVFFGTLDQVHTGLWVTQSRYFESLFVVWKYPEQWAYFDVLHFIRIPMPGGYLLGFALLINLLSAHIYRFRLSWKKVGITMIHLGLILLLLSEFITDIVAVESRMAIPEGSEAHYSEAHRENELVFIDTSHEEYDEVTSIPVSRLKTGETLDVPQLPFTIHTVNYFPNSAVSFREQNPRFPESPADRGLGANKGSPRDLLIVELPVTYDDDSINTVSALLRLEGREGAYLGTWLVSNVLDDRFPPQIVDAGESSYEMALRFKRYYHDFGLKLIDFRFDRYPGTEIARNFSSEVQILDPELNSPRDALIYMNNPLRYGGLTFFQASFDEKTEETTILQVVRNPGWILPYVSVILMGLGMSTQFLMHLIRFSMRRRSREASP